MWDILAYTDADVKTKCPDTYDKNKMYVLNHQYYDQGRESR